MNPTTDKENLSDLLIFRKKSDKLFSDIVCPSDNNFLCKKFFNYTSLEYPLYHQNML